MNQDVQGATFSGNSYALVRPSDDREYLYTTMTRGAAGNFAFAVTDEQPKDTGTPVAAPEVARASALAAEQAGETTHARRTNSGTSVLAVVLDRASAELSPIEELERAFSDADSLATLSRIWVDLTAGEYRRRYASVLRDHLGPDWAAQVSGDYRYTWLCRTLRAAELAGLSGSRVLAQAIEQGSLDSAESVAAVLDYRARQIIPGTLALGGSWAARSPRLADPGADRLLAQVGQAINDRTQRLGEYVAATMLLWVERTLGPVSRDPVQRQAWLDRAAAIEAFREMSGWRSTGDPIGPAPEVTAPEHRAAWHTALIALANDDGVDPSHLSDDQLPARRSLDAQETARAPLHPGRELRLSRLARDHAAVRATRAQREAAAAAAPDIRGKHVAYADRWAAVRDRAA